MNRINRSVSLLLGILLFVGYSLTIASGQNDQADIKSIEGVWQTVVTPRICSTGAAVGPTFPGILMFSSGGTMSGTSTAATSVYGIWSRENGPRQYSFATISLRYDVSGNLVGTRRIHQSVVEDESGETLTTSGGFQDFDLGGNQVAAGCSTATGTRYK